MTAASGFAEREFTPVMVAVDPAVVSSGSAMATDMTSCPQRALISASPPGFTTPLISIVLRPAFQASCCSDEVFGSLGA